MLQSLWQVTLPQRPIELVTANTGRGSILDGTRGPAKCDQTVIVERCQVLFRGFLQRRYQNNVCLIKLRTK